MQDLHTKCGGLKTKDKEVIPITVKNPKFCSLSLEHCSYNVIWAVKYVATCT